MFIEGEVGIRGRVYWRVAFISLFLFQNTTFIRGRQLKKEIQ